MNKQLLKSRMALFNETQAQLAAFMGISLSRLNAKINEAKGAEFTQNEIGIIAAHYQMSAGDVAAIFFAEKVS